MTSDRRPVLIPWGAALKKFRRALYATQGELSADESASTLFRFFRSAHVIDLRVIVWGACLIALTAFFLFLLLGVLDATWPPEPTQSPRGVAWLVEFFSLFTKYFAPVLGITGVIIAWAYRSASARLGVIDLFAGEIGTLCRVGAVFDVGQLYVDRYNDGPIIAKQRPIQSTKFISQEDYFPVFDKNSHDLQLLEALVVKHITEFYTYMKVTRDALRGLEITSLAEPAEGKLGSVNPWQAALANVIYAMFLGYESARKATDALIEFEPTKAESIIVILLTELKCYSMLVTHFKEDDLRHSRLKGRENYYKAEVPALYCKVTSRALDDQDWSDALRTIPELAKRYEEAVKEKMNDAIDRIKREKS